MMLGSAMGVSREQFNLLLNTFFYAMTACGTEDLKTIFDVVKHIDVNEISVLAGKLRSARSNIERAIALSEHNNPRSLGVATALPLRLFSSDNCKHCKMVDPQRVVSYEDMLKVIHQPEKVIIDVRNPDEVSLTGKIPSSINIPLSTVSDTLASMSEEEFKKQFQRPKPSSSDELIFYCQSGRRSTEALDKALKLGYARSKTYLGSWNDWSSRQK